MKYVLGAVLIIAMIAGAMALAFRTVASDGNFNIDDVDVTGQLETDGTLHVVDHRTVSCDANTRNIYWQLESTSEVSKIKIEGARIIKSDATVTQLASRRYDYNWTGALDFDKQTDTGERGAFAFDDVNNIVYIFLSDELQELDNAVIEVVYSIEKSIYIYDDVAELYWTYYSGSDRGATPSLNMKFASPVESGQEARPGTNIWAWGHGPSGAIDFQEGIYLISSNNSSSHADGRFHVIMDKSWLSNVDRTSGIIAHGTRKDYAIYEEQKWTDSTLYSAVNTQIVNIAILLLSLASLLVGTYRYYRKFIAYRDLQRGEGSEVISFDKQTLVLQRRYLIAAGIVFVLGLFAFVMYKAWIGAIFSLAVGALFILLANWCPYFKKSWRDTLCP